MPVKKTRQKMREQDPKERIKNFREVPLGYTREQAIEEAKRCLHCKDPPCMKGCPVGIEIPRFIKHIADGEFDKAIAAIKEKNALPAVTGRVCPHEIQCEGQCTMGKLGEPIAIGRLERFVADLERDKGSKIPERMKPTGKKVAVVGSGPASLTCASHLAMKGHKVIVFEALSEAGGVLRYGIPEFRLPKKILDEELNYVKKLGVEVRADTLIGKTMTLKELQKEYDAVFIGTGAGLPMWMGVLGENLCGIYSANEFLTRVNLMKAYRFPEYDTPVRIGERVATIGAGNVAMDCARTALRLGAKESYIIYRRSEEEAPARREEIVHAREEGVVFKFLTQSVRYIGDEHCCVKAMECIRMELGEPDKSGRRSPVPVEGSEFVMDVDTVIVAIGQRPNPLLTRADKRLEVTSHGTIKADEDGRTSIPGVFAGGDITTGAATVILAMGAGQRAAKAIDEYLKNA
ncbi:MAG: NADPH-dependent glutamate synthase [Candidatus Altiarchaeota archaeon]|nr:NADPH-dependent glutamate synthase [Candidatus Altiarchaeota archaeon]